MSLIHTEKNPAKTMGIWSFVAGLIIWPLGLILGIIALVTSSKAGWGNGWAIAGICVSAGWALLVLIQYTL